MILRRKIWLINLEHHGSRSADGNVNKTNHRVWHGSVFVKFRRKKSPGVSRGQVVREGPAKNLAGTLSGSIDDRCFAARLGNINAFAGSFFIPVAFARYKNRSTVFDVAPSPLALRLFVFSAINFVCHSLPNSRRIRSTTSTTPRPPPR